MRDLIDLDFSCEADVALSTTAKASTPPEIQLNSSTDHPQTREETTDGPDDHDNRLSTFVPSIISLDVGGIITRAYRTTLDRCPRLAELAQGWNELTQCDGSIYVDAEFHVFMHLLNYLRLPYVCPLFWTKADGFDYQLYAQLGEAARHFGVKELADWIEEKGYKKVVKWVVKYEGPVEVKANAAIPEIVLGANEEVEHRFIKSKRSVYVCPRKVAGHFKPENCGKDCKEKRKDSGGLLSCYEMETFTQLVTVRKTLVVDLEMLKVSSAKVKY